MAHKKLSFLLIAIMFLGCFSGFAVPSSSAQIKTITYDSGTVNLQKPTLTDYTEVEKSDYTTIILFVISLILCIVGLALTVPLLPLISLTISVINIILLSEPSIFNILLIILNVTFTIIALVRVKTKNN